MTKFYSSSKHALGRAKKERSQISEGRLPQIATGAKRLLVALLFAVVLANNAAAQWASINYTVHPQSLFQSVECNGNGNNSWWSGYIKYTDNDAYDSGTHGVCVYTCNFQCNIWDDHAFPSTSNQADRVTFTLLDVVDDICATSASQSVDCATYGEFSRTKMLREDAPSISNWTSIQWGAVANQTGGRHDASANYKWHYVTLPNDPIIQLSTCPGEIVETYAANATGRIPSWAVSLTAGTTYVFSTCGSSFDAYLSIFGSNGYTVLASVDQGCGNQSVLSFTCPATGVYFLELTKWLSVSNTRGSFTDPFVIRMATVDNQAPTGINAANPLSFDTLYTCSNAEVAAPSVIPPVRNFRDNCSADPASVSLNSLGYDYPMEGWEEGGAVFNWNFSPQSGDFYDQSQTSPWTIASDNAYSGSNSIKSSPIGDGYYSRFTTSVDFSQENTVSFQFKTSTEEGYDWLQVLVDGVIQEQWSGTWDWTIAGVTIPAGVHVLEWRYAKDFSGALGEDACWVDDIYIPVSADETVLTGFPEIHTRTYSIFDDAGNSSQASQTVFVGNVDQILAGGIVEQQGTYSTAAMFELLNTGGDQSLLDMYSFEWIDCDNNSEVLSTTPTFALPTALQGHHFTLRCNFMDACLQFTPCFPEYDVTPPSGFIEDVYACSQSEVPVASDVVVLDLTDNIPGLDIEVSLVSEIPGSTQIPLIIQRNYALTDLAGNSTAVSQLLYNANLDLLLASVDYVDGVISAQLAPADWAADQYLYQWVDCTNNNAPIIGANSSSFTPLASGTYALQCSYVPFGAGTGAYCIDLSTCIEVTIASVENEIATQFTVYPNPNNTDELHFNYNGTIEHVSIYNVVGELVLSNNTMGSTTINIASLAPGEYIVKMHSAAGDLTNPLIVTE